MIHSPGAGGAGGVADFFVRAMVHSPCLLTRGARQGNFGERGGLRVGSRSRLVEASAREIRPALLFALLLIILLPDRRKVNPSTTRRGMDFKTATDRLTERITADDIADAFEVARNTIARARLDRSNPGYRPPPENWKPVLARLAWERSRELAAFADELAPRSKE